MKKLLFVVLMLAATSSLANDVTGSVKYDYDRSSSSVSASSHTAVTGLKYQLGKIEGAIDAGFVQRQDVISTRDNTVGVDIGYSNGFKYKAVTVLGRAGYRNMLFSDKEEVRLSVEGFTPIGKNLAGVVGYESIRSMSTDSLQFGQRGFVGADVTATKKLKVRVGYSYTHFPIAKANGLTTAVSYKF